MKRKKTTNQVIAGTLAAGFLTASCTQYHIPEQELSNNTEMGDFDLGQIAIPISLKLNPDDAKYIMVIQKLTDDILRKPSVAKDLNLDPESVLRQYGYNGVVNLDDGLLKIVQALSDTDLVNAIKTNNFKTFLNICSEKGLLKSTESIFLSSDYEQQLNSLLQHKDVNKYLEENKILLKSGAIDGVNNGDDVDEIIVKAWTFVIPIVVAAAVVAVVAVAAETVFLVHSSVSFVSATASESDFSTVDIFVLNSDHRDAFIVVDKEIEDMTNTTIDVIKTVEPNYFNTVSETETRNLIKINLVNNLY